MSIITDGGKLKYTIEKQIRLNFKMLKLVID